MHYTSARARDIVLYRVRGARSSHCRGQAIAQQRRARVSNRRGAASVSIYMYAHVYTAIYSSDFRCRGMQRFDLGVGACVYNPDIHACVGAWRALQALFRSYARMSVRGWKGRVLDGFCVCEGDCCGWIFEWDGLKDNTWGKLVFWKIT